MLDILFDFRYIMHMREVPCMGCTVAVEYGSGINQ